MFEITTKVVRYTQDLDTWIRFGLCAWIPSLCTEDADTLRDKGAIIITYRDAVITVTVRPMAEA